MRGLLLAGLVAAAAGAVVAVRNNERILASQSAKDVADRIAEGASMTAERAHVVADSLQSGAFAVADGTRADTDTVADRAAAADAAASVDSAVTEAAERVAATAWESTVEIEEQQPHHPSSAGARSPHR